jgi:hypothetical protein
VPKEETAIPQAMPSALRGRWMTHKEEYENFVEAGYDEYDEYEYPLEPCRLCNDYPCRCLIDEDVDILRGETHGIRANHDWDGK